MLAPGQPIHEDSGLHEPTQLHVARAHGTHNTHETKTKQKEGRKNRADKPMTHMAEGPVAQSPSVSQ